MSGAPSCNVMYYTMEACGDDSAKPGAFKLTKKEMVACLFEKATGTTGEDEGGIKGVQSNMAAAIVDASRIPASPS